MWKTSSSGYSYRDVDFDDAFQIEPVSEEKQAEWRTQSEMYFAPAPDGKVIGWLETLAYMSPPRRQAEFDTAGVVRAYMTRLREYPADIVRFALTKRDYDWFPSWTELGEVMNPLLRVRKRIVENIERIS